MRNICALLLLGVALACVSAVAADVSKCIGEKNILDYATSEGSDTLSTLVEATKAAGFQDGLSREGPIGLIAPTNEAFVITLGGMGITAEQLMEHPEVLKPILSYHILLDDVSCDESLEGDVETALEGNFVRLNGSKITDGFGDEANIIKTVWTSNGPIYIVDRVLFPDIPDTSEPQKDDEAEIVPAPEVAAESNEVVSDVASTGSTASEDADLKRNPL